MPSPYDLDREGLAQLLTGEPPFRTQQVWDAIYRQHLRFDEMTSVPKALRARLAAQLPGALSEERESVAGSGQTIKWLLGLPDGARIETVLMHYPDRSTVCVSTQAGCAMACGFCATGQGGFQRQLSAGEIIEQVMHACRRSRPRRVSHVVLMGMGEPLANYDNVLAGLHRLHDDAGISARHLTVSTVGLVPGIERLAGEALPVNLAVSLHAANDDLRNELVPINRRYPLATLSAACHRYLQTKNRRLTLEWALIEGVNDQAADAAELAAFARPLRAHVNLIPLNATAGYALPGSRPERIATFRECLTDLGVNATTRHSRGADIDGACGQLRASQLGSGSSLPATSTGGDVTSGTDDPPDGP